MKTSGVGLYACKVIKLVSPESRIFLVARNWEKACYAEKQVRSIVKNGARDNVFPMVCDHSSLKSVYSFCGELKNKLHDLATTRDKSQQIGIDVLCLNAAVLLGEDEMAKMTADDIELTFQINHLAPFLIGNILTDVINPGGRVVVTTSGLQQWAGFNNFEGLVHPTTGQPLEKVITVDGSEFDSKQSYSLSKLCNVAFTLALDRRLRSKNATAICFTPGLIPKSGLFRHRKTWAETMTRKEALGIADTKEWGGCFLAWMALSDEAGKNGGSYWRSPLGISKRGGILPDCLFCDVVNKEASDQDNQEKLWRISAELTGMTRDTGAL
jgi:NAD(P)-dependent dehydrogenase (short-subunit alcohol dehydrogenase family)